MCKAFSCLVTRGDKVYWKTDLDSHEEILREFQKQDTNLSDNRPPPLNTFARIEIVPPEGDYLNTDFPIWKHQINEKITPSFLSDKHEDLCRDALTEWAKVVYTFNLEEARNPINPFKIVPPEKITEQHIALLQKAYSVSVLMDASVWASVKDSAPNSVWASVEALVWNSVRNSVACALVWDSAWASIWASMWDAMWAYQGSLFPIKEWKGEYPFQPFVDLWKIGLVPSFDEKVWRLHGGEKAEILWEGNFKEE